MASTNSTKSRIREMILQGELEPGERVTEQDVAERLGISRTPIRAVLPALAEEGLLVPVGRRGYAVRAFSPQESIAALRARSTLEGLAARVLASQPNRRDLLEPVHEILAVGDRLLGQIMPPNELESEYGELNSRFHTVIIEASSMPILRELVERCNVIPFVSPANVAFDRHSDEEKRAMLTYAHHQHHHIMDAIMSGDGARADALFKEHAYTQEYSMQPA